MWRWIRSKLESWISGWICLLGQFKPTEISVISNWQCSCLHPAEAKGERNLCVCFNLVCLFWVWEPWACSFAGRWHYQVHVHWAYVRGELNYLERSLWALGTRKEMRKDRRFGTVWANFMWKSKTHRVRVGGRMCYLRHLRWCLFAQWRAACKSKSRKGNRWYDFGWREVVIDSFSLFIRGAEGKQDL